MIIAGMTSNLTPTITLSIYTGIAFLTDRSPLTVAQTFMALSIISLASSPLSNFVYSAPKLGGAIESFRRIQEYLLAKSRNDYRNNRSSHISRDIPDLIRNIQDYNFELRERDAENTNLALGSVCPTADVATLHQASFGWNKSTAKLIDISLRMSLASLTMIVGPVGSGKSMILRAILGEVHCIKGSVQMQQPLKIAYCDAKP